MKRKAILTTVTFTFILSTLAQLSESSIAKNNLEYLLSQRMSIRNWSNIPIEDEIIKTICKNSFASAFELKGIELYVLNSSGTYQYDKEKNLFILKSSQDMRHEIGLEIEQTFIANAPCIIAVAWNNEIEPSPLSAHRKGGIIVQNLYILATRYNLGGVCVGDRIYATAHTINIQEHLGLLSNLKPVLLFPIGYLSKGQSYPTGNLQPTSGNLPNPLESSIDVMELFQKPHQLSIKWENVSVPQQKLSNILWATYGYSLLGTGHRTMPSAHGEYPFQIYLCNETGVYNYTAESHSLYQISFIDKRSDVIKHANAPEYLERAPALFVFCWNNQVGTHNASDSDSGGRFINVGYGCCLQNLYLSANVWNVGISEAAYTTSYDALRKDIADTLPSHIYPMYLVGAGDLSTYLTLTVSVKDQYDKALPNAAVSIRWPNGTTIQTLHTDENGSTVSRQLPIGSYIVTATYQQYSASQTIELNEDKTIAIRITIPTPTPTPTPPGLPTPQLLIPILILLAVIITTYITYRHVRK